MSAENLATWKATTKPPCSSPGPGFHPWSSLVFHGMHTKREVAPPEATCLLMVCKGRGAELLPMCAVGMGLLHKPLHPAGQGLGFVHCPTVNLHPEEIGRTLLAWPGTGAAWSFPTPPCRTWLVSFGWCWALLAGNPAFCFLHGGLIYTKQV